MKFLALSMVLYGLLGEGETLPKEAPLLPQAFLGYEDFFSWFNSIYWKKELFDDQQIPRPVPRSVSYMALENLCSCETQYEIRDLGEGHYPRYITSSRCKAPKAKRCQTKFNSCRLLHYVVHVLRLREFAVDEKEDEGVLPESLRHQWQLHPMSVPVACISANEAAKK
ncbi:prothoracicotropic hormone-like [Prorops nasuta]|uniref:prothoracicotropic hormone-like n=1 Tax=Prorops nasuta TaxID=863751 RepID=UPI0034CF4839